jgi:beta-lactam-binding protein with PASTA domain
VEGLADDREGGTIAAQTPAAGEDASPAERVVLVLEGAEPQEEQETSADTE